MSPWISSDTTRTSWRRQIAPRRAKLLARPDPAHRVVRIAQEDHAGSRVARRARSSPSKSISYRPSRRISGFSTMPPSVFGDDVGEIEEDGRLNDDAVARLRETDSPPSQVRSARWARAGYGRVDGPSMPLSSQPVSAGIKSLGHRLIAKNAMRSPLRRSRRRCMGRRGNPCRPRPRETGPSRLAPSTSR